MPWSTADTESFRQLLDTTNLAVPAATTSFGPYPVASNLSAVRCVIDNIVGASALARFDFYVDDAEQQFSGSHLAVVRNNGALTISWPILGSWMTFRITPVAPITVDLRVATASDAGKPQSNSNQNTLISTTPVVIAAAGTTTTYAPRTYPGPAVWTAGYTGADVGPWEAFLESENQNGVVSFLDYMCSVEGTYQARPVYLPARPVRIRFVNRDAANPHTYAASLTADAELF